MPVTALTPSSAAAGGAATGSGAASRLLDWPAGLADSSPEVPSTLTAALTALGSWCAMLTRVPGAETA